jgi:hypothetical protein
VTVTLNDGRKIERSKYYPSGTVQAPMSPAQIKAKFDIAPRRRSTIRRPKKSTRC